MALESEKANNKIFNVGSGLATTVNEVANTLKELYKSSVNISINGKFRLGDIRHNYADLTKITSILGFVPEVDFKTGITKFVEWVKLQEIHEDKYADSIIELKQKGLIK